MKKWFLIGFVFFGFLFNLQAGEQLLIKNWVICGPFGGANLDSEVVPDEAELVPKIGEYGSGKLWRQYSFVKETMNLEEKPAFGYQDMSVGYAYVEINSPEEGWLGLHLGSDDGIKVWWNSKLVLRHQVARAVTIAEDRVHLKVQKGTNRLLLKISDLYGGWGFSAKLISINDFDLETLSLNPLAESVTRLPLRKVVASTAQGGDLQLFDPMFAVDNDMNTRWSAEHYVPQWYVLYFKDSFDIARIDIYWENAYASQYRLEYTRDGKIWEDLYTQLEGDGGHEIIILDDVVKATGLRFYGNEKATDWGMSFWEFEAYGFAPDAENFNEALDDLEAELAKPLPVARVTASSEQPPNPAKEESFEPKLAVDNNTGTRWSSRHEDPQWISLDLGEIKTIQQIVLLWETAKATNYIIEISKDGIQWELVFSIEDEEDLFRTIFFKQPIEARHVRMTGTKRKTVWGYSLWEFQVFEVD